MSIQFKSITELRAMLDDKSISSSELIQESLQLAKKYKELNCFVTMNEEISVKKAIDNYTLQAGAHKHNTRILTQYLKDSFRQQQLRREVSLAIFLFVLILFLLFKKFNVFGNIWNLIVKK